MKPRIIRKVIHRAPSVSLGKHGAEMHTPEVSDHGSMGGLLDDDHTQYLLASGGRDLTGTQNTQTLLPVTTGMYDLGSLAKKYATAYITSLLSTVGSFSTSVTTNQILEFGAGAGVTIDGVLCKDGDVVVGGNGLVTTNLEVNELSSTFLRIVAKGTTTKRSFQVDILSANSFEGATAVCTMRPKIDNWPQTQLQAWTGAAWTECLNIKGGLWGQFAEIVKAGDITMLDQKMMQLGTYTDAQRPAAGTAGRVIFNTDDGMPNYDDGTDWRDVNGNIT